MKPTKLLSVVILFSLMLAGLSAPGLTSPLAQGSGMPDAGLSKVDPAVLDQIAVNGQAKFYAILTVQADLSGAAALPTKVAKTTYVFNLLRETARQTQQPLTQYLDRQGLDYRAYYIANMIEVTGGQSVIEWLAARPDVARISVPPDPHKEPVIHDATPQPERLTTIEWNITRVGAPDVWAMGFHGEGMVVGGNDTGVSYTHPALINQYRGNLGGGSFDHNYNWWGGAGSTAPSDGDGHGTHTMGTMVGDDGGTNQIGMAPGAKWIACAGLGGADTVECFEFFLAPWNLNHLNPDPSKAPDSINNSWYDTSGFDYRPIIQSLNAAGVAVIKSAGNWGSGCDTISPPGNVPEIIATAAFGQGDVIADFSSRGPSSTYGSTILKPEVAAPGVNVRSSVPGGGYDGTYSGTSMAAPHSTGLVALIWSAAPCLQGDVPTTKQIMMETAEAKIDAQCPPFVGHPNDVWGWGILDAEAAVQMAMGYCGGLGGLEGTVTAAGSPLEGVDVRAEAAGGFTRSDTTDIAGLYAMQVLSDTYTVTATKYGYGSVVVPGVEVVSDVTTTLDIVMAALPEHTVSGYVRDSVNNAPLAAVIQFVDAPVPPVSTDPATGFYSIQVAEGTWHLQATAPLHLAGTQEVVVTGDVTQDFYLDPLPCTLLVDDDTGDNYETYYAAALAAIGQDYILWDVATAGSPTADDLANYGQVVWLTGDDYSSTLSSDDQAALTAYLDGGGKLFISGQDIGYDINTSAFYGGYLHASYITDDTNVMTLTGADIMTGIDVTISGGDGANNQAYPSAIGLGAGAVGLYDYTGATYTWGALRWEGAYRVVYFAFGFEAINAAATRATVMGAVLDWLNGCECSPVQDAGFTWAPDQPLAGEPVSFVASAGGSAPILYSWDFGDGNTGVGATISHAFDQPGTYTVILTASNGCGSETVTHTVTVLCDLVTIGGTYYEATGCTAAFGAVLTGAPPFTFAWDFGAFGTSTDPSPTVDFGVSGTYPYTVTVTNCGGVASGTVVDTATVECCEEVYSPRFGWEPASPLEDQEVVFTGTASGTATISFAWDYGDGTTGAGQTSMHTYAAGGDYTVVMTATNCAGSTATDTQTITVRSKTYIYLPIVIRGE
jgi:PKD repeat protein